MTPSIQLVADIYASRGGESIHIHGSGNTLTMDADAWAPILDLGRQTGTLSFEGLPVPVPDLDLQINVRGSRVCLVRLRDGNVRRRFRPLGMIISLFRRRQARISDAAT